MWLVIGIYLLLVFGLPVAIGGAISYRGLPRGRACPHCRGDTLQLLAPLLRRCSVLLPATSLQRRWCMGCGWEGAIRLARADVAPAATSQDHRRRGGRVRRSGSGTGARSRRPPREEIAQSPAPPATRDGRAVGPNDVARRATQTLDVRSLTLDGTPWRVMLQCWRNTECYYGRFVFVAPSGRLWLDSIEAFTGASENEVLGQALSLSDGLLAHRLRRLVSDC